MAPERPDCFAAAAEEAACFLLLCWSLYRYRTVHAQILSESFAPPVTSLTVLTLSVIFLGAITTLILMLG